ncbi:MAG: DUF4956 domain-containing protein [Oscillospiraceae bacterium]|nr:DUF4956 domain-containing protein [Oscillospiraceae bacterium]
MNIKGFFMNIWSFFSKGLQSDVIPDAQLLAVLLFTVAMSAFIFLVYRIVSHRALYNKSLNICLAVIPSFICTIILCLQSNIVITLGTIGALAIIRFRTAVKDPVDMVYILWSIHLGIMAGCQLYMVAVLTSVFVAVILLVWENLRLGKGAYTLVVNCEKQMESTIVAAIGNQARKLRIKSRNFTSSGVDYIIMLFTRNPEKLTEALNGVEGIRRFSLIEFDNEDIV